MSRIFHIWWLVIIAIIVIALIVVWALYGGSQTLSANNLYDAVNDSAMYAREKGSRMDRGTFVINRKLFEDRLGQYKIKGYGRVGTKSAQPSKLYVHYLIDNKDTNDYNKNTNYYNGNVVNGYIGANNYKDNDSSVKDDIPIRAIQVQAVASGHNPKKAYIASQGEKVIDKAVSQKLNDTNNKNKINSYTNSIKQSQNLADQARSNQVRNHFQNHANNLQRNLNRFINHLKNEVKNDPIVRSRAHTARINAKNADSSSHYSKSIMSVSNTRDKYVATDVVQVADKDPESNDGEDDNQPIRNPNSTKRNSDDPTVNSFIGTDGSPAESNGHAVDSSDNA